MAIDEQAHPTTVGCSDDDVNELDVVVAAMSQQQGEQP
jgi:hypothetical protein